MLEIASEIIICLLLATLIGFALGYLVAKSQSQNSKPVRSSETVEKEEPEAEELTLEEPQKEDTDVEETKASEEVEIPTENAIGQALEALEALEDIEEEEEKSEAGQKPELLSQPRNEGKDNLTDIKGIGPKVEEKLNAAGIYHFEQIANWSEANMIWLEAHTLFASRVKKELWIEESKSFLA